MLKTFGTYKIDLLIVVELYRVHAVDTNLDQVSDHLHSVQIHGLGTLTHSGSMSPCVETSRCSGQRIRHYRGLSSWFRDK
jgi:hypothetical protein